METRTLTANDVGRAAWRLAEYLAETHDLEGSGLAKDAAIKALVAGFGTDGVPKAGGRWNRTLAEEAVREHLAGSVGAAVSASLAAVEHDLAEYPVPPRAVTAHLLASAVRRSGLMRLWIDDMPELCGHPGFARLCRSVVESACMDPDVFAESNAGELEDFRGGTTLRDRKADRAIPRIVEALRALARRPLHPAWPALVLMSLADRCVGDLDNALDRVRESSADEEDIEDMVLAGSFVGRGSAKIAATMPHEMLDYLYNMSNSRLAELCDAVISGMGVTLLGMGPVFATLAPMKDMPAPCCPPDGTPNLLDRDRQPWGHLGEPDRWGWCRITRSREPHPLRGLFSRIAMRPEPARAAIAALPPGGVSADGVFSSADAAEAVLVVGMGARPHAVVPVLAARLSTVVEVDGGETVVRYVLGAPSMDPQFPGERALAAVAHTLDEVAEHDTWARRTALDEPGALRVRVRVSFDVSAAETALPGLAETLAAKEGRHDLEKSPGTGWRTPAGDAGQAPATPG